MAEFQWTEPRRNAAQLLSDANLTYQEIAESIGVTRQTLYNWLDAPEFASEVERLRQRAREEIRSRGVGVLEKRVQRLNRTWLNLQRVIEERAADPAVASAPGGMTGLVVRTVKGLGSGENFTTIEEFAVDVAVLKELRDIEKQAAQELGQWVERRDLTTGNAPFATVQQRMLANPTALALACELDAQIAGPIAPANDAGAMGVSG